MYSLYSQIWLYLLIVTLFAPVYSAQCEEFQPSEHQVKAAVVYNISRYVSWPTVAIPPTSDFIIGIFSHSSRSSAWNSLHGKQIQGHQIKIQRITDIDEATTCQVIIIEQSERKNVPRILAALKESPVLTISEIEGFGLYGGMITLRIIQNQLKFDINLKNVRASGLTMSSNLLKLAIEVIQ